MALKHKISLLKRVATYHIENRILILLLFFTATTVLTDLQAQFPGQQKTVNLPDSLISFDSTAVQLDTLIISRYRLQDLTEALPVSGTELNRTLRQAEYAREPGIERAHLGNMGSPLLSLAYEGLEKQGIRIGNNGLDPWIFQPHDLDFYKLNQAVANFQFVQTANQQNIRFEADFSRDVMKNLNFSLKYRRINHNGQYENQRNKHAFISTGLWYHSDDERWNSVLSYSSSSFNEESNGGITTDTLFGDPDRQLRLTIPVHLDQAGIIVQDRQLLSQTTYAIAKNESEFLQVSYKLHFQSQRYRFSDINIQDNDDFYGRLAVDDRGLRNAYRFRTWSNELGLETQLGKAAVRNEIGLSIRSTLRLEEMNLDVDNFAPIQLIGRWRSELGKRYELNADGLLAINETRGRYRLRGEMTGEIIPKLSLRAGLQTGSYDAGWIYERLLLSGIELENNDFKNIQEDHLSGTISWNQDLISGSVHLFRIDGHTYFDSDFQARQASDNIFIQRIEMSWNLPWHVFRWHGTAFLQNYEEPLSGLPSRYLKSGITYQDLWFKENLEVQLGLEARLTDRYDLPGWQPALMSFYYQEEEQASNHIPVDAFFQFKIDDFRAFIQAENLSDILTDEIYYSVAGYPMNEFLLRFGFSWRLLN